MTPDIPMKVELLPCPFCGRQPRVIPDTSYGEARVMCCDDCPVQPIASAELADGETLQTAIAAWNTRPSPANPLPDEVAELIERLRSLKWQVMTEVGMMPDDTAHRAADLIERLSTDRDSVLRRSFALTWTAASRPPIHPDPMRGAQRFATFERAIDFMTKQPSDVQFGALIEIVERRVDRSDDAAAAIRARQTA